MFWVFAVTEPGIDFIESTVRRIHENGNVVTFNFYSRYGVADPLQMKNAQSLQDEAIRVAAMYPDTVLSTPTYIRAIITGATDWGKFGYDVCPSISVDHPAHEERLLNGNKTLPLFNAYAPDLKTVNFCCTSGHCEDCRDSQAVNSWLMVSTEKFMTSPQALEDWIDLAEAYWAQFIWSPFHHSKGFVRKRAASQRAKQASATALSASANIGA